MDMPLPPAPPVMSPTRHEPLYGSSLDHDVAPFVLALRTASDATHLFPINTLERLNELRQDLAADPMRDATVLVRRDPMAVGDNYDRWIRVIRDGASAYAQANLELPGFFKVLVRALEGQRDQEIAGVEWVHATEWIRDATTTEGSPPPLRFTPPAGLRGWVMCAGVVPDPPAAKGCFPGPGFGSAAGWPTAPGPTMPGPGSSKTVPSP